MAATATAVKLSSILNVKCALSGDATAGIAISFTDDGGTWLDMRDYESVMFILLAAALTGVGLDADDCHIVASASSDGSSPTTVFTHSNVTPDAAGDYIVLEATAEQLGENNRYVSVNIDAANASDQIAIIAIRGNSRNPKAGLTADYIS